MSYYHLPTSTERDPRPGEQRIDTSDWITPLDGAWSDDDLALCGFLSITETAAPTPAPTEAVVPAVGLVSGLPVRSWSTRPKTDTELAVDTQAAEQATARTDLIAQVEQATTVAKLRAAVLAAIETGTL